MDFPLSAVNSYMFDFPTSIAKLLYILHVNFHFSVFTLHLNLSSACTLLITNMFYFLQYVYIYDPLKMMYDVMERILV